MVKFYLKKLISVLWKEYSQNTHNDEIFNSISKINHSEKKLT